MIKVEQKGNIEALFFKLDPAVSLLNYATTEMVNMAKDKAPVAKEAYSDYDRKTEKRVKRRPGRLRKNIKKSNRKHSFRVYIDMGTRGAPYGIFQEVGFRHHRSNKVYAGHFFMEEAYNATMAYLSNGIRKVASSCLTYETHNNKALVKYR